MIFTGCIMGFFSAILDFLFPPKCVFCSRVLSSPDDDWCDKCTEALPYADFHGRLEGDIFDFCISPLYYTDVVRRSILRYKFGGASYYANSYGKLLADCIRDNSDLDYDIISWVPLSSKRKSSRGYDQAMLLAQATALELDNTAVETLSKSVDVQAQSELGDKAERSANISGAFIASDPNIVAGKSVLLIDDVVTTCSTLDECARILKSAGASNVFCAALARGA